MPKLSIPHSFNKNNVIEDVAHEENFAQIAGVVNNLDDDNISTSAAIDENKVLFNASGHAHSGKPGDGKIVPGKYVTIAKDAIFPLTPAEEGTIKIDSGHIAVASETESANINFATLFTEAPMVFVIQAISPPPADGNRRHVGGYPEWPPDGEGFCITQLAWNHFRIMNWSVFTQYQWFAMGI